MSETAERLRAVVSEWTLDGEPLTTGEPWMVLTRGDRLEALVKEYQAAGTEYEGIKTLHPYLDSILPWRRRKAERDIEAARVRFVTINNTLAEMGVTFTRIVPGSITSGKIQAR